MKLVTCRPASAARLLPCMSTTSDEVAVRDVLARDVAIGSCLMLSASSTVMSTTTISPLVVENEPPVSVWVLVGLRPEFCAVIAVTLVLLARTGSENVIVRTWATMSRSKPTIVGSAVSAVNVLTSKAESLPRAALETPKTSLTRLAS